MYSRIGEQNINEQGEWMSICDYTNHNNITVIWKSDNSTQKTTYSAFKHGKVVKREAKELNEWIGMEVNDADGLSAEIIEVNSENDVSVHYPDGDIVARLSLDDAISGKFHKERSMSVAEHILFDKKRKKRDIAEVREETFNNVCYTLDRFRRCLMVRPCGFGKTMIGIKLFRLPQYKKCLFLHPQKDDLNASKIKGCHLDKKIDVKTYAWLRGLTKSQIKNLDYDIVFMDEVHGVGGNDSKGAVKTFAAVMLLMATHPETHFVGATATPFRMDGINVAHDVFLDHTCYPYSDTEAFEDGLLKKPFYRYCVYDVVKKVRDEIGKSGGKHVTLDRDEVAKNLKLTDKDLEEINIAYMDRHIRESCDKVIKDTSYMRFIVYYLTNEEIAKNRKKVEAWFKKAYPNHEVASIVVTSRTDKDLNDVDNLPTKPSSPEYEGRIDLIFNCEMLCMGYHSELITGLVIDRKTQSLIKFLQMIGRLLSCDNDYPVIIFDVVDNIHSDFVTGSSGSLPIVNITPVPTQKEKLTYLSVVRSNPAAVNWANVKKNNEKAKKAEKYTRVYREEYESEQKPSSEASADKPASRLVHNGKDVTKDDIDSLTDLHSPEISPEEKKTLKEELDRAFKEISGSNVSWMDAVNMLAGIENEFGVSGVSSEEWKPSDTSPAPAKTPTKEEETRDEGDILETADDLSAEKVLKNITDETEDDCGESEMSKTDADSGKTTEEESLGYLKGLYAYWSDTGECYSKNAQLLCLSIDDYTERIKEFNKQMALADIEYVIEKWHSLDPICEEDYKSYDEIDKKSPKYKLLAACARMYGNGPVELVLKYMIEGTV